MKKALALAALAAVVLTAAATAGVSALSGTVTADGSSTVGPYAIAAAEGFQKKNKNARVTVGIAGTGGGFERFCRNEIDLVERVSSDEAGRGDQMPRRRCQVGRVHRGQRRPLGGGEPPEHLGELPDGGGAEEGLGARLQGQQLESDPGQLPERAAEALRRRHRLRHLRLLHRGDQRAGPGRAAPITSRPRTTTSSSRASRASAARWATSATPTTRRTRTS